MLAKCLSRGRLFRLALHFLLLVILCNIPYQHIKDGEDPERFAAMMAQYSRRMACVDTTNKKIEVYLPYKGMVYGSFFFQGRYRVKI